MKTKFFNALSLAVIMAMMFTSLALADQVINTIDNTIDPALETKTIVEGGSAVVGFYIKNINTQQGGDPVNSCNVSDTYPATVTFDVPSGVTANPSSLTFTDCNQNTQTKYVTFSSNTADTYEISVSSVTGGKQGGAWDTAPAAFALEVDEASDSTPPIITSNVSGILGSNGWYVNDVTVSWTVTDSESTVTSKTGCDPTIISSDTAGATLTCSATSAGGTSSQSVTIKRDATAPTISGQASPAANGAGWNNTGVNVTFSCSDVLSGIASCGPAQTLNGDGANQSATGVATDMAGNSMSATVSGINIDMTAPTIYGVASPSANSNGWNNSDVTVSFTCGDGLSGVVSCGPDQTLSEEGAGQSATGNAKDNAGNIASATVSNINIDKTAPSVSTSASPVPNSNGWNNSAVTVGFSGSDALSGIDSCDAPVVLSSEGAGQSASGSCADKAGNSASATASGIDIDMTAPVVAVTGVSNGATYILGSVPVAGCSTTDALSGVATPASLSMSGGPVVGSFTATCSGASDNAGNLGTASATYKVIYNWNGFFQPIDNNMLNVVKAGSGIPVKFSLSGNQGLNIFAAGYPSSTQVACGNSAEDAIETTVTAGGSSLSYDALADQYVYVWKTEKSWAGTCRTLVVKLVDGTFHYANFKFK